MASNPNVEIVTEADRCLQIVERLSEFDFIALDAEGINLGKDGPLTLLQIGTVDDKVYLFDIETNKDLFRKGKLKDLLQSEKPVKVIHSCAGDSAALYHQFGIKLTNVFDTQVAHLVIEENRGQKLPSSMKLSDVCQIFNDKAKPLDQKDEFKVKWTKEDGELWARRPLTAEMIEYASNDVTSLIPSVILEENNLLSIYQERVDDEINYYIDETAPQRRRTRINGIVKSIISDMERKYGRDKTFQDITDQDEINALKQLRFEAEAMSPFIKQIKTEAIKAQLKELNEQLSSEGNNFIPNSRSYGYLRAYQYIPDKDIQEEAKRLQKALDTIILSDMANKYSLNTKFNVVKQCERDALQSIRPRNKDDNNVNPILLSLYWQKQEMDLDFEMEQLEISGRSYSISQGKYKWIKFSCSGNVPNGVKIKAKRQLVKLDQTFGRGKYSV